MLFGSALINRRPFCVQGPWSEMIDAADRTNDAGSARTVPVAGAVARASGFCEGEARVENSWLSA